MLEPIKEIDWRTLMAAQSGGLDARQLIAMAFRDLADNADKVGNLNISPDLLNTLLGAGVGESEGRACQGRQRAQTQSWRSEVIAVVDKGTGSSWQLVTP